MPARAQEAEPKKTRTQARRVVMAVSIAVTHKHWPHPQKKKAFDAWTVMHVYY